MIRSDNEAKDENEEINEPEIASIPSEERDEDVEEDLQASQDGEEEEGDDAEDAENANEDEDERKWFRTYFFDRIHLENFKNIICYHKKDIQHIFPERDYFSFTMIVLIMTIQRV